jgi:N-carbamoyl-L-amino-acid hydrolase
MSGVLSVSGVLDNLRELRQLSEDANGAQRVAWTPLWMQVRDWFRSKAHGLAYHQDSAGNDWYTLAGASERTLLIGSHLDSVPNGGWLDGSLGVLAGLAVVRRIAAEYDGRPPLTIQLVDFADEEGSFGRSILGSSALAGHHTIEQDRGKRKDGVTLEEALRACGVEIDRFPEAEAGRANIAAYLELHIEQSPYLEKAGLPLAAVVGTRGVERFAYQFFGQESHAGTTPMRDRRDALAAAAAFALEVRAIALQYAEAVATVGFLTTWPGIPTAIPGRCELTLDCRDLDPAVLEGMKQQALTAAYRIATGEGCAINAQRIYNIEPVKFHPELIALAEQAIWQTMGTSMRLSSGALHDATALARAGIPTVMMFVQSLDGISHSRREDTRPEHLELAARAFDTLATLTMHWILESKT